MEKLKDQDYKIHLQEEKDKYVIIRQTNPRFMIYVDFKDQQLDITKIILLENCSAHVLGKALIEFESYFMGNLNQG